MDLQTGLIYVGVVVISAAVILLVSMFGIKEKSYEEAIAEQRKLPDDLLLGKKDKSKDKKHKSKTGKKVKEKIEEKDDKDDKPEHVQFEETPQIFSPEINPQEVCKGNKKKIKPEKVKPILVNKDESPVVVPELNALQSATVEINHFDVIQPKDDLELVRSQSKENLQQASQQSEPVVTKSPKDTPTKSKKNVAKEPVKKKEEVKEKEEKKEANVNVNAAVTTPHPSPKDSNKESTKELQKDLQKDVALSSSQSINKENNKKNKKKNDILAQIGGDKDAVHISLLGPLIQKAELSRSEIQILIDQLLNKQQDNATEHSEWTEGRADQVIKLKKQLAEKDKALAEEHEASMTYQNKVKELRSELNSEKSKLNATIKQLEESLNAKSTEAQTHQTRMQHILETHAAEKQGFARQIEQLQAKVNEDAAIIHKMQEDQGQTQGHLQQELIAQRKQLEVQFAQMRDTENTLKQQLAQKHIEIQELQNVNMSINAELQATCENSEHEIEALRQQLVMMREQQIHTEGHLKEASDRIQDMVRQLDEIRRLNADLDHKFQNAHRHEQEFKKQVHSLQAELKMAKAEASEASALNGELNKVQSELTKLKSDAAEVMNLRGLLNNKEEELRKIQMELTQCQQELNKSQIEVKKLESTLNDTNNELNKVHVELAKLREEMKHDKNELKKLEDQLKIVKEKLSITEDELNKIKSAEDIKITKTETEQLQNGDKSSSDIQISKLQHENDLKVQLDKLTELQKEVNRLHEEKTELVKQQAMLQRDANNQNNLNKRLKDDLEAQRLKNDELRTKNWKVMEALSAAESRIKSNSGTNIDEYINKIKSTEQEATKSLLQRIFPDVKIAEKSYDQWLKAFEERVHGVLIENKKQGTPDIDADVIKEKKKLQNAVAHYKQVILDTEAMLNNLQNHVESEESRWNASLRQKENEVVNLRIELQELRNRTTLHDKLQEKISQLELRLKEDETQKPNNKADLVKVTTTHTSPIKNVSFVNIEQLQEEKQRLSQDLETERNKNASLDSELNKLRTLVDKSEETLNQEKQLVLQLQSELMRLENKSCGAGSSGDQCVNNGPPTSDSSNSAQMRATHSLLAAIEKTLVKNSEPENCTSITSTNLVESLQQIDQESFTSILNSDNNCHTTDDYDNKAQWNPMICQQNKKHKKKRKGGSGKK